MMGVMLFTDLIKASGVTQAEAVELMNAKWPSIELTLNQLKNYTSGRRVIPGPVFACAEDLWKDRLTPEQLKPDTGDQSVTPNLTPADTDTKSVTQKHGGATPEEVISEVQRKSLNCSGVATNVLPEMSVLRMTAEVGHQEWDIMEDGYARGYAGDNTLMRAWYRTPSALRRIKEAADPRLKADRITSMQFLPNVFKIDAQGRPVTLEGKIIKMKPDVLTEVK